MVHNWLQVDGDSLHVDLSGAEKFALTVSSKQHQEQEEQAAGRGGCIGVWPERATSSSGAGEAEQCPASTVIVQADAARGWSLVALHDAAPTAAVDFVSVQPSEENGSLTQVGGCMLTDTRQSAWDMRDLQLCTSTLNASMTSQMHHDCTYLCYALVLLPSDLTRS